MHAVSELGSELGMSVMAVVKTRLPRFKDSGICNITKPSSKNVIYGRTKHGVLDLAFNNVA